MITNSDRIRILAARIAKLETHAREQNAAIRELILILAAREASKAKDVFEVVH